MALYEIPYIYQAEVLESGKRKLSMFNIVDTLVFEIPEIHLEKLPIVALNIKQQWTSEEGATKNKLLSYILEHNDNLLKPMNYYSNNEKLYPEQIKANDELTNLVPETTVLTDFKLLIREPFFIENFQNECNKIFQLTDEYCKHGFIPNNFSPKFYSFDVKIKMPIVKDIANINVKDWISDNKNVKKTQLLEKLKSMNLVVINNILYMKASLPIWKLDYGHILKNQTFSFNPSKKLEWNGYKDVNKINIPLTFLSSLDNLKKYDIPGVKFLNKKENNGDTYILNMEKLVKYIDPNDVLNNIITMLPISHIYYTNDNNEILCLDEHPILSQIDFTEFDNDKADIYMHVLNALSENISLVSYDGVKKISGHIEPITNSIFLEKLFMAKILHETYKNYIQTPVEKLENINLHKAYKPNPGYKKYLESRSRFRSSSTYHRFGY